MFLLFADTKIVQFGAGKSDIYMKTSLPNVFIVGKLVSKPWMEKQKGQNAQPPKDLALFCPHGRETETLVPNTHLAERGERMEIILSSSKWQMWQQMWWTVAQYECVTAQ